MYAYVFMHVCMRGVKSEKSLNICMGGKGEGRGGGTRPNRYWATFISYTFKQATSYSSLTL